MRPTDEQQAVIDAVCAGGHVAVQAGAGTGKTSTLQMAAGELDGTGLYVAYNKSIATEAAGRFPEHVTCKTGHALAFRQVGYRYSHRLGGARRPAQEVARLLGTRWLDLGSDISLSPVAVARVAGDTVRRFCYSADEEVGAAHVPFQHGVSGARHTKLVDVVLPYARRIWEDGNDPGGELPYDHDFYLKKWAMTGPRLPYDTIFLDEAQDSNDLMSTLIRSQDHAQQVIIGDGCQQLYGWRGARDVMSDWPGATRLYLSQSWRFGQVIADVANQWLAELPTPLRLLGDPSIDSVLEVDGEADAVLCRTNAGALSVVLDLLDDDVAVAMVGGGSALAKLARAAADLQSGKRTGHPELYAFRSWDAVREYAQFDEAGHDLLPFVNLIDTHGPDTVIAATTRLVDEASATTVVSTVHKAKGREWNSVRIGEDFYVPRPDADEISQTEAMVGYVAVTRARYRLDRGGLAWINDYGNEMAEKN